MDNSDPFDAAIAPDGRGLSTRFLAERHGLLAYILGLVHRVEVAEDIFQEVWLRVAGAEEDGEAVHDPPRWFRGVARNLILHHWRSERRSRTIVDSELVELIDQAFDENDSRSEALEARERGLRTCMAALSSAMQGLLRMIYVDGISTQEASARLNRTPESILMMLSRGRRSLAECIARRVRSEGGLA